MSRALTEGIRLQTGNLLREMVRIMCSSSVEYSHTKTITGTNYTPGLGACGETNGPDDMIVAVGWNSFDNFPCVDQMI